MQGLMCVTLRDGRPALCHLLLAAQPDLLTLHHLLLTVQPNLLALHPDLLTLHHTLLALRPILLALHPCNVKCLPRIAG